MELVCPAGTPAALRAAVDAGAHTIYCGFADETNARNFPGLNFSREELAEGVAYAHARGAHVLVAINTFPRAGDQALWHRAVADAARLGADAVILADLGLIAHAAEAHPGLRLHLSVQAAAANPDAINFYARTFGIRRVVLPRVLSVEEITAINREIDVETEVFVFGGLCVMAEGRCSLSSYATGLSPNMNGVCSPASHVAYADVGGNHEARLGDFLIHRTPKGMPVPYPTLCKGCFTSPDGKGDSQTGHIFEDPVSLDATRLIPALQKAGVRALKIEGRQRSRAYVAQVVRAFRAAVEAAEQGAPMPEGLLARLTEGQAATTGAYAKTWR
ncbi:U32 family peptidase [Paracoccus sp. PS-1]|uniref:ubiquinone anaerobic biosynthesis protein UbiU n=1 Tax=unclassified Paracoccus (in: a-proteobacteria) TaxID=2688777 RepID=UPI00048ECE61|nr:MULTISPECIES: peptidase U32 family protein [unclassified Paracoccus (in: a-proteobacteria)]MDQ7262920.1 U32 family peptidase [Paracoccus sp. PS1]